VVSPSWDAVVGRDYVPRTDPRVVIDTATTDPEAAAMQLADRIATARAEAEMPGRAAPRLPPPPALR
jgi:hypothetical protein